MSLPVAGLLGLVAGLMVGVGLAFGWRRRLLQVLGFQARLLETLQRTTLQHRRLLGNNPTILYTLRQAGAGLVPVEVSDNVERLLGFQFQDVLQPSWWLEHLHPEDRESALRVFRALEERDEVAHEYRFRRRDGTWLWVEDRVTVLRREEGAPVEVIGAWTDVTERKHLAQRTERLAHLYAALSFSNEAIVRCATEEELFLQVCEGAVVHGGMSMAWVGMVDEETRMVRVVAAHGTGLEYLEGIRISIDGESPLGQGPTGAAIREDRARWTLDFMEDPSTAPWHERGAAFGWRASGALPLTRAGRPVGALTLYARSTEAFDAEGRRLLEEMAGNLSFALDGFAREARRVEAEEALREKEQLLIQSQRIAHIGSWSLDAEGRAFWTDEMFRLFGLQPERRPPAFEDYLARVHPDDVSRVREVMAANWRGEATGEVGYRAVHPDGTVRYLSSLGEMHLDGEGRPCVTGTVQDVTERRQADRARAESEARYRALVENSPVAIFVNAADRIVLVNEAAMTLFGATSPDQLLGRSPLDLFHPESHDLVRRRIQEILRTGRAVPPVEERILRLDGSTVPVETLAAPFPMGGEKAIHVVMTDLTFRKQVEGELVSSLREKEALLKEVHHRVKNNLQVINSLLRLEAGRSPQPEVKAVLGEMQNRILSMALLHETLYRSGNLARIDLAAYLGRVARQLFRSLGPASSRVRLHLDLEPASVELEQAVPCALLVNELVSNCLKHAFPGGRVGEVRLELHRLEGGSGLRLEVGDDGVGLPSDFAQRREHSLGLQLVTDLARQLGGTLEVGGGPGTRFTLSFGPRVADGTSAWGH